MGLVKWDALGYHTIGLWLPVKCWSRYKQQDTQEMSQNTTVVPSLTSISNRLFCSCSKAVQRYYPGLPPVANAAIMGYCTTGGFSPDLTFRVTKTDEISDLDSTDLIISYFTYLGYKTPTAAVVGGEVQISIGLI